ncbi:S9 family peptidase [Alkalicoccobacillus murimartini]|uniref:Dipeptidyl aminopeptidase/acylaminoacyl peptidase n=1 Tax=Alkalicoccobacillus murimartini TaxID=171685 RepID=A0ABT9YLP0_9BACI|nr:S9 family peptidase [Alkalicoccobacillus murimartini]MDQ0208554.1 dipeptidyl aminopeptidase/acylaminoacyl peptidase [Alkalicoccobacillus murimartini]
MITFDKPEAKQFFELSKIGTFAVSPQEDQIVFSSNISGEYELWAMDSDSRFPYKLTSIGENCHDLLYSKDGSFIIASFDHEGDENAQIYALPKEGGTLKALVQKEGQRHMIEGLSDDGHRLYYNTTDDNPTYLNSNVYDLKTGEIKTVYQGEGAPSFLAAKNINETRFIVIKTYSNTHSVPYLFENDTLTSLVEQPDEGYAFGSAIFTSDKDLYFTTNYNQNYFYLAHYDAETKVMTKVLEKHGIDLIGLKVNQAKDTLYITSTSGVSNELWEYDIKNNELEEIKIPTTQLIQFVLSKKDTLYVAGGTAIKPINLYKATPEQRWEQLTNITVQGIDQGYLSEPSIIHYKSFDGLEIEGLYFKARAEVDNHHLILWPHGGPQAAEVKSFRAMFQHLAYEGYSIVAPNFRGSSNYGSDFKKMVEGDWGHGPRLDNITCVDYMIEQGYAEKDKILLMGGSYGGYMALLLHGRHPEYFKAVVDIFGVSNLFSFYDSVPEFWKPIMKQWIGDPVDDKERFTRDSPTTYLETMTKPMLVIQGANDPRVVKAESDQIVESLRAQGTDIEYIVFEDEGHGFSKKENEITVSERVLAFFNQYIG